MGIVTKGKNNALPIKSWELRRPVSLGLAGLLLSSRSRAKNGDCGKKDGTADKRGWR
jgi:hypothetical protein